MARILIIDDQSGFLSLIAHVLTSKGYEVTPISEGAAALPALQEAAYDLVICDIWMQPVGGMEVLRQLRKQHPDLPVVMLTGHGSVETALESLNLGAFDYITKPFEMADMIWTVERALECADTGERLDRVPEVIYGADDLVVNSGPMQALMGTIRKLAPTGLPLLITGEVGVGKRRVASAVHALAGRSADTYFELNCAELATDPDASHTAGGTGESGDGLGASSGTLCFVNVEMLPPPFQVELLAMLKHRQTHPPDDQQSLQRAAAGPRVIATTAVNITTYVEQGLFDRELFERLNRFAFRVPPLRERRNDILPLTHHFMRALGSGQIRSLDADVRALLEHYDWRGNAAELRAVVDSFAQVAPGLSIARERLPVALQKSALVTAAPATRRPLPSARGRWLRSFLKASNENVPALSNA